MTPAAGAQAASQSQITALGDRMEQGFNELKQIMTGVEGRVRGLENREAGCQPIVNARMDAVWKRVDEHDAEIKELRSTITELKQTNKILTWLGGLVGSAFVLWVVGFFLGLIH
jgi:hypothetical protein